MWIVEVFKSLFFLSIAWRLFKITCVERIRFGIRLVGKEILDLLRYLCSFMILIPLTWQPKMSIRVRNPESFFFSRKKFKKRTEMSVTQKVDHIDLGSISFNLSLRGAQVYFEVDLKLYIFLYILVEITQNFLFSIRSSPEAWWKLLKWLWIWFHDLSRDKRNRIWNGRTFVKATFMEPFWACQPLSNESNKL